MLCKDLSVGLQVEASCLYAAGFMHRLVVLSFFLAFCPVVTWGKKGQSWKNLRHIATSSFREMFLLLFQNSFWREDNNNLMIVSFSEVCRWRDGRKGVGIGILLNIKSERKYLACTTFPDCCSLQNLWLCIFSIGKLNTCQNLPWTSQRPLLYLLILNFCLEIWEQCAIFIEFLFACFSFLGGLLVLLLFFTFVCVCVFHRSSFVPIKKKKKKTVCLLWTLIVNSFYRYVCILVIIWEFRCVKE